MVLDYLENIIVACGIDMNENIKAGADIHAGDGGYGIGTKENYEAFVKVRNKSLAQARIKELAKQSGLWFVTQREDLINDFAELIIKECVDICIEHPSRIVSNNWHPTTVSADIAYRLEEHFGVE